MDNQEKTAALYLSLALACIDAVMQSEPPKSAKWNRLAGAVDPINRAVEIYRLEAFSTAELANACSLVDLINDRIKELYP